MELTLKGSCKMQANVFATHTGDLCRLSRGLVGSRLPRWLVGDCIAIASSTTKIHKACTAFATLCKILSHSAATSQAHRRYQAIELDRQRPRKDTTGMTAEEEAENS